MYNQVDLEKMNRDAMNNNRQENNDTIDVSDEYQGQVSRNLQPVGESKPDIFFGHNHQMDVERANFKNKGVQMKAFNEHSNRFAGGCCAKHTQEFKRKYAQRPTQKLNGMRPMLGMNSNLSNNISQSIISTGNKYGKAKNIFKTPSKLKPFIKPSNKKKMGINFNSLF